MKLYKFSMVEVQTHDMTYTVLAEDLAEARTKAERGVTESETDHGLSRVMERRFIDLIEVEEANGE